MHTSRGQNKYENIAMEYAKLLGALDGKHIIIQAFPNGGSLYVNYKGLYINISYL